ncbi:uncharacterized protein LOC143461800 isoform X2 [Clavelina lepadiformis]|uniref:uncharacterized protein LOC143461800 isoform X2 n=1 Tax=Clavelina lepadiformis TaxID=159417 RepID=UPI0040428DD5
MSFSLAEALSKTEFWDKMPEDFDCCLFLEPLQEKGYLSMKEAWEIRLKHPNISRLKALINAVDLSANQMTGNNEIQTTKQMIDHEMQRQGNDLGANLHELILNEIADVITINIEILLGANTKPGLRVALGQARNELDKAKRLMSSSQVVQNYTKTNVSDIHQTRAAWLLGRQFVRDYHNSRRSSYQDSSINNGMCCLWHAQSNHVQPYTNRPHDWCISNDYSKVTDLFAANCTCTCCQSQLNSQSHRSHELTNNREKVNNVRSRENDLCGYSKHYLVTRRASSLVSTVDYVYSTKSTEVLHSAERALKLIKSRNGCLACKDIYSTNEIMTSFAEPANAICSAGKTRLTTTPLEGLDEERPLSRLSSITQVKVTNGEIAQAIAKVSSLEGPRLGLLDKLRNFAAPSPKPAYRRSLESSISDDDYYSDNDTGSVSSFTSVSSFSSCALSSWLEDEFEPEEGEEHEEEEVISGDCAKEDIIFQIPAQQTVSCFCIEKNSANPEDKQLEPDRKLKVKEKADKSLGLIKQNGSAESCSETCGLIRTEVVTNLTNEMNTKQTVKKSASGVNDQMWESQKSVFWSMKHLLVTTTDFVQVLPDLLKLRLFTEEQLKFNNNFQNSSSIAILRAVGERIDANKSAMAMFMVALRSHNSELVDKMHQKVFASVRCQGTRPSNWTSQQGDAFKKEEKFEPIANRLQHVGNAYRHHQPDSQPSRYSRRPFSVHPASDADNIRDIRQNYVMAPTSNAYFRKASYSRSMTPTPLTINSKPRKTFETPFTDQRRFDKTFLGNTDPSRDIAEIKNGIELATLIEKRCSIEPEHITEATASKILPTESAGTVAKNNEKMVDQTIFSEPFTQEASTEYPNKSELVATVECQDDCPSLLLSDDARPLASDDAVMREESSEPSLVSPPTLLAVEAPAQAMTDEEAETIPGPCTIDLANKVTNSFSKEPLFVEIENKEQEATEKSARDLTEEKIQDLENDEEKLVVSVQLGDHPTSSLRRSASCRFESTRRKIEEVDEKELHDRDEKPSNLAKGVVGRKRSNSCITKGSIIVPLPVIKRKSRTSKTDAGLEQQLKSLAQRLESLGDVIKTTMDQEAVLSIDIKNIDVNAFVTEMVSHCIISTRSAWLIRKCADHVDRIDQFLGVMIGLDPSDVADVIQLCPKTTEFIAQVVKNADKEIKNVPENVKIINDAEISQTTNTEVDPATPNRDISETSKISQDNLSSSSNSTILDFSQSASTHRDDSECDDTGSEETVTPPSFSQTSGERENLASSEQALWSKNKNCCYDRGQKTADICHQADLPLVKLSPSPENNIVRQEREESSTSGTDEEKGNETFPHIHEKRDGETVFYFENDCKAGDQQCVEVAGDCFVDARELSRLNENCKPQESDLKAEESSQTSKIDSKQRARVQLFIKNPTVKAKLQQRSFKSGRNSPALNNPSSEGHYVSQILFPISTRKNSINRKAAQENLNSKQTTEAIAGQDSDLTPASTTTAGNQKPVNLEEKLTIKSEVKVDMPPVLSVNSASQKNICLHDSSIGENFSSSVSFPLKSSTDSEVFLENDINNNNNHGEVCKSPLTTILTNGGNISPPSSLKKKVGHRVSFSDLPPIEIELERQVKYRLSMSEKTSATSPKGNSSALVMTTKPQPPPPVKPAVVTSNTRPATPMPSSDTLKAPLLTKMSTPPTPSTNEEEDILKRGSKIPLPVNEIDQINELLMDILEEIEAENISLNRCLYDLVKVNLLSDKLASTVSPTYEESCRKYKETGDKEVLENQLPETDRERCVEKLLDVLTNLGLETLSKCRNCILGRLCQLSTYEDYETAQKAAAAANGSPTLERSPVNYEILVDGDAMNAGDHGNGNVSARHMTGRNPSSEESEFSATESDDDIHMLRHHFGRHRGAVGSNLTIKEVEEEEEQHVAKDSPEKPADKQVKDIVIKKRIINIREMLTMLIDEGIVEPRQVWMILGAGSDSAQKAKLKRDLQHLDNATLTRLYGVAGLEDLQFLMEDEELDEEVKNIPYLRSFGMRSCKNRMTNKTNSNPEKPSSVHISDLHGGVTSSRSLKTDTTQMMDEHSALMRSQEQRLSQLTSLSTRTKMGKDKPSTVSNSPQSDNSQDPTTSSIERSGDPLYEWCQRNNLSDQSATALRKGGYTDPSQLQDLTEDGIEELNGLSWLHKAKLWVAIENLRLDAFYRKSHSGLTDILNLLET